jgi:Tol biopolymer transport system component
MDEVGLTGRCRTNGEERSMRWMRRTCLALAAAVSLIVGSATSGFAYTPIVLTTAWISLNRDGSPNDNCYSSRPSVSRDGRVVAFDSCAPLTPGAPPNTGNVWYRVMPQGALHQVDLTPDGSQPEPDQFSGLSTVSANGSTIVYASSAHDLVSSDLNGQTDVFAYDQATGTNSTVSVSSHGDQGNDYSGIRLGGGGVGEGVAVSYNGRYVVFAAGASNLVKRDTNSAPDVFWHDRVTGRTRLVSVATDGTQASAESGMPAVSGNGRFVAFTSDAKNLVAGDSTQGREVFLHDMKTGSTTLVSQSTTGEEQAEPSNGWGSQDSPWAISRDGSVVVFSSDATNFDPRTEADGAFHAYVRDVSAGTTTLVDLTRSFTAGGGDKPSVSADGRFVAFTSASGDFGPFDANAVPDVYVLDRTRDPMFAFAIASVGPDWQPGDAPSGNYFSGPDISPDGRFVAFSSAADDFFSGDDNGDEDCFVRGPYPSPDG